MQRWLNISCLIGVLWLSLGVGPLWCQGDPVQETLREYVERLRATHTLTVGQSRIASVILLPALYERRNFRLLWTDPAAVEQLLDAIRDSDQEGLDRRDYHWSALQHLQTQLATGAASGPEAVVQFDLLLTDSLIRLGYHLLFGKVDPEALDANWNLARDIGDLDPVRAIQDAVEAKAVTRLLDDLKPKHVFYQRLKAALAQYRAIQAAGGWQPVPAGPTLRRGMTDPRVTALRRRLMVTGDLKEASAEAMVFDADLEEAVKHFQRRHGLEADGAVGPATLQALNVPVEDRIDQIRVNLERSRWVLHQIHGNFVVVDIAGFQVFYVQDDHVVWKARAVVGRPYRKTPIFKSTLTYLVLNPTWTVPPTILAQDILPAVRRDSTYLQKRDIQVIDRRGRVVDPRTVNWAGYQGNNFPYQLRQAPGPNNALGRIKFMFPNPHLVYLHDTPSRELFDRPGRAFSSGCIRVEKPFELAELLLNDPINWSQSALLRAAASNVTQTVFLPTPVPVLLLYWTVDVSEQGVVTFKPDVYERDQAVLAGLRGEFVFRKRPILGEPILGLEQP